MDKSIQEIIEELSFDETISKRIECITNLKEKFKRMKTIQASRKYFQFSNLFIQNLSLLGITFCFQINKKISYLCKSK